MLSRQRLCRHHVGGCGLQLILPAAHDAALARHHRLETILRHLGRVTLFLGARFVSNMSARRKNSVAVGPGIKQVTDRGGRPQANSRIEFKDSAAAAPLRRLRA
jgi:hypothetical protein